MNEQSIFTAALERMPAERRAFLDGSCADNRELRERVEKLLASHAAAVGFMDQPAGLLARTIDQPFPEKPGTRIGPYKLLEQIGDGGMGVVYMAEQQEPVRRKVALKVIKPGMDTQQVVRRFEAERQALAMMNHPNIAKVLDGGTTAAGRPYFVMDLVKGAPITEFCDQQKLDTRGRLQLFITVCQAVQHAHLKGLIHRDLKPSNVLVEIHDVTPVPKVIDFGVAKAIGQQLTEKSLHTGFSQMLGTPLYMSPEQAGQSSIDVDTRSDIYSLGVLLYEILTGQTPFDSETLRNVGWDETRRMIREVDPPRPSARVSTLQAQALSTLAECRRLDPHKFGKQLRGELDWIVMKALEKDRNRRYESATALAADVQRYINDEPVLACPPSAGYRCRKFARKNRVPLTTAAVVVATLIISTVVSAWLAVRATQAGKIAQQQRDRAVAAEQRAKQSDTDARAVLEFFQEKVLTAARPNGQDGGLGIDASIGTAVNAAEPQIGPAFREQPLVEASIRYTLGVTYGYMGEQTLAIRQLERSRQLRSDHLGRNHSDTLKTMHELATAYRESGRPGVAIPLHEQVLQQRRVSLGPDHPDTLMTLHELATAYGWNGDREKAVKLFQLALDKRKATLGPDHLDTLRTVDAVGVIGLWGGRAQERIALYQENLKKRKAKLGPDHADTLMSTINLAHAYNYSGRPDLAVPLFQHTLERRRAILGPDHIHTFAAVNGLASAYQKIGNFDQALPLYEMGLEHVKGMFGLAHPDTLLCMLRLAEVCRQADKADQAVQLDTQVLEFHERMVEQMKTMPVPDQGTFRVPLYELADHFRDLGKLDLAVPLYEQYLEWAKAESFHDIPRAVSCVKSLIRAYHDAGRDRNGDLACMSREFLELLGRQIQAVESSEPGDLSARQLRAVLYFETGRFDDALADIGAAVELNSTDTSAFKWIPLPDVAACTDKGFRVGVVALADKAIERTNGSPEAYLARASLHAAMRHFDEALRDIESVGTDAGYMFDAEPQNNLAWHLATTVDPAVRDVRMAVQHAQFAVKVVPSEGTYWNTLGVSLYRAEDWNGAVTALQKSMDLRQGGDSFDWFFLAMAHSQMGDTEQADKWYNQAVTWMDENQPRNDELNRFRAETAKLLGRALTSNTPADASSEPVVPLSDQ